ncbi:hypothetical protein [Geomicrobium sp. JCM 19038]|uniref:hypothetical protein n=1 Tax=Geomicrobium sp. JCM 19038 TaxID=1460635 RepID=UPI00045F479A|nr:hypothetical protein [Geomicrobium sp. JCM 19038]GAK09610.1 hypothetical protein JCM19038_3454 [Geomicrobium sp. JCM 19038]
MNVILQPAGNRDATSNYERTINTADTLDFIKTNVKDDDLLQAIKNRYKESKVPIWGVSPGEDKVNEKKWKKINAGDLVLFSSKGKIFSVGHVSMTFHNKELAEALWGTDKAGKVWEYIYLIDDVKNVNIEVEDLNIVIGYKKNNTIQGIMVLDKVKSNRVIEFIDYKSSKQVIPIKSFEQTIKKLDELEELEKDVIVKQRAEQPTLREYLLGGKTSENCALCNKEYLVGFLVAAHVKKRSECNKMEKLDINNIIIPVCKFGCDELFERGLIGVKEGLIIENNKSTKDITPPMKLTIKELIGNKVEHFNEKSKDYFNSHRIFHNFDD